MARKLVTVMMIFEVPEDFDGDINDALEEAVRYRREKGYDRNNVGVPSNEYHDDLVKKTDKMLYDLFDRSHRSERLKSIARTYELNKAGTAWLPTKDLTSKPDQD